MSPITHPSWFPLFGNPPGSFHFSFPASLAASCGELKVLLELIRPQWESWAGIVKRRIISMMWPKAGMHYVGNRSFGAWEVRSTAFFSPSAPLGRSSRQRCRGSTRPARRVGHDASSPRVGGITIRSIRAGPKDRPAVPTRRCCKCSGRIRRRALGR